MIFRKKSTLDFSNEIKGGNGGNSVFKNVLVSFLEKIGLVSIRCELETEMSIDISADEMQIIFKRQDTNFENLERDMEKMSRIMDRFVEKSIRMGVKAAKDAIKGFNEVKHDLVKIMEEDEQSNLKRKERHEKMYQSEEDKEDRGDQEETILGFHDYDI